ncbi:MAG: SRPBCC domain-containing protein [Flavobacteriaceae bacterium]
MSDLIIKETYDAPVSTVWKALTDKDEMKKWYFELPEFKAEVGFKFTFPGQARDGKEYIHLCEVTEVIPLKKLQYSWCYKGYEGRSLVTFELEALQDQTILTLTHSGIDNFPKEAKDLHRGNFEKGWTELLTQIFPKYLKEL